MDSFSKLVEQVTPQSRTMMCHKISIAALFCDAAFLYALTHTEYIQISTILQCLLRF